MLLKNKVMLVTGGSSGIGRTTALAFVREGAKVAVVDVDEAGGSETVALVRKAGGDGMFIRADVSLATEVEEMVKRTVQNFGGLDGAFNNAAAVRAHLEAIGPTHEYPEENWDQVIAVNLKGVWL